MTLHSWTDGDVLYAADLNSSFLTLGILGEIRQVALSYTGAETLSNMITYGWAVCDGTTPASQGVSDPIITTTPNLAARFLYGHATTSGTTGGATTNSHTHTVAVSATREFNNGGETTPAAPNTYSTSAPSDTNILPPYYTVVFFMKVK